MDVVLGIALVALVATVLFAVVGALNILFVVADPRCGYRPWRVPDRRPVPRDADMDEPSHIRAKVVVGWPERGGLDPAVIKIDGARAHVSGGGAQAQIERSAIGSVRTFRRSALGSGFVFDSPDRRYGGIVVFPDDLGAAIATLRERGWPVDGPLASRARAEAS